MQSLLIPRCNPFPFQIFESEGQIAELSIHGISLNIRDTDILSIVLLQTLNPSFVTCYWYPVGNSRTLFIKRQDLVAIICCYAPFAAAPDNDVLFDGATLWTTIEGKPCHAILTIADRKVLLFSQYNSTFRFCLDLDRPVQKQLAIDLLDSYNFRAFQLCSAVVKSM